MSFPMLQLNFPMANLVKCSALRTLHDAKLKRRWMCHTLLEETLLNSGTAESVHQTSVTAKGQPAYSAGCEPRISSPISPRLQTLVFLRGMGSKSVIGVREIREVKIKRTKSA
jgi:hypothetical protein